MDGEDELKEEDLKGRQIKLAQIRCGTNPGNLV